MNGIYPIGSLVQLSSGEQARVMKQTADADRPVIRIEVDETGGTLDHDASLVRDLTWERDPGAPRIVGVVDAA